MGIFIVFEGLDGVGKSTLIEAVYSSLLLEGYNVSSLREPTHTELGKKVREISNTGVDNATKALLFAADRVNHIETVINPLLEKNHIVLCDRFVLSSLVYQGWMQNDFDFVLNINEKAMKMNIDMVFLLTMPSEERISRMLDRGELTFLDEESIQKTKKLEEGYELMKEYFKITEINALDELEVKRDYILSQIKHKLGLYNL